MLKRRARSKRTPQPEIPAWREDAFDQFSRAVQLPLLVLAVLMIPIIIVPLVTNLPRSIQSAFDTVDYFIWAVFVAEYAIRFVLAPRRWHFVTHNPFDLVVVAVPILRPLNIVRSAEALRLARLTRLGAFAGEGTSKGRAALHVRGLSYVAAVTGFLIVVTSVVVYDLERTAHGASIRNWGDSLWWAIVTVTTVGYGDKVPVTAGGRGVAVVLMLAGIALISVLTAALATYFVSHSSGSRNSSPRAVTPLVATTARDLGSSEVPAEAFGALLDRITNIEHSLATIAATVVRPDGTPTDRPDRSVPPPT